MEQKKSKFTSLAGTALLTSALLFPGCDLAKPKNIQQELSEEPVVEVTEQPPAAPQPVPTVQTKQEPDTAIIQPPVVRSSPAKSESAPEPLPKPKQPKSSLKMRADMPPEKAAVVEQLWQELKQGRTRCPGSNETASERTEYLKNMLGNINPMLVGKHVVFDSKWSTYIGPGKPLTQKQFEIWRDKTDKVYESYVDLTGTTPVKGEKIFVDLQPGKVFPNSETAHAHGTTNVICFNKDSQSFKSILQELASHDSYNATIMHELAHLFANDQNWEVAAESIPDVLIAYAMETISGAQYGIPGDRRFFGQKTVGTAHRKRVYDRASDALRASKIDALKRGSSVYELYIYGLVDKVGWDTYKQVFRSYNDKAFTPNKYSTRNQITQARDFFDRIEHFSGKPGVLRTLPDKGVLLDKFFNVQVAQQNLTPAPTAQRNTGIQQMQYVQEKDR